MTACLLFQEVAGENEFDDSDNDMELNEDDEGEDDNSSDSDTDYESPELDDRLSRRSSAALRYGRRSNYRDARQLRGRSERQLRG